MTNATQNTTVATEADIAAIAQDAIDTGKVVVADTPAAIEYVTVNLPSARITAQTIIAAPHASVGGIERWITKVECKSFKALGKGKGVQIVIDPAKLAARGLDIEALTAK